MATAQVAEPGTVELGQELPAAFAMVRRGTPATDLASPAEITAFRRQFDDEAFMAQVMGEVLDKWFYEFTIQGKTVEGVSATGASEFGRIRAEQGFPIRFPPGSIVVEEVTRNGEIGIQATVVARDARTGGEGIGVAFYPWYAERKNGGRAFDDKADRKAVSVAQRNAILELVPEALIVSVLKERKQLVKANEARRVAEAQAASRERIASAPQVRAITAGQHLAEQNGRDEYEGHRQAASGEALSEAGAFVMPFGRSKGSPVGTLTTKDLEGAIQWAQEKGKFAEFIEAAGTVLAERSGGELPLGDARRGSTRIAD